MNVFGETALDRMNIENPATPQHQIGADRPGETPIDERSALVMARKPKENYAQATARTTQPGNLVDEDGFSGEEFINWERPSLSEQAATAAGPDWLRMGFVPAFMEVYGDLLKGMTPHEVGCFASEVFLKMTR